MGTNEKFADLVANRPDSEVLVADWGRADVVFSAEGPLGEAYAAAVTQLLDAVVQHGTQPAILHEAGAYPGCWVESTASIGAETLARFLPGVAAETVRRIVRHLRDDGMLPYKVTAGPGGETVPSYRQIQMVTPFARSVGTIADLSGEPSLVADAYPALAAHDRWLAEHRDTRGSGGVEAFATYDTGHDRSPRFWHVPDVPHLDDPSQFDPDNPRLPFIAPDLTANVASQRRELAAMARRLGEDQSPWLAAAEASTAALFEQCWDSTDQFFYDRDATGELVKVQSDVLLRVLSCGIGDDAFFDEALRRYLLNTRKFFAHFPFTCLALDDPRFDPRIEHNSWAGPTNALAVLRAPAAFETHGRFVELAWAMWPTITTLAKEPRFAQTWHPWTGEQGFTSGYSPAVLTLLDFVERCCGILPRRDGDLWVSGLVTPMVQHDVAATATSYGRSHAGVHYELHVSRAGCVLVADGAELATFPPGVRLVLRDGEVAEVVGLTARTVTGRLTLPGRTVDVAVAGNERWEVRGAPRKVAERGVIAPR
ncbi:MAG TPA: hypothetical protein PKM36_01490 [Propionibacteriaceae bacterium]|nr:hypothetical protein [Propionibacteriaceae bacterium]HQE32134.1 hypothetical protein [Propionibacteriaceae bacterium]